MNYSDIVELLERDTLIYTAAIHWNVIRSASNSEPPKIIYVHEFIEMIAKKIEGTFDMNLMNKHSVMHLAHWYTENLIRSEYSKLVETYTKHNGEI